GSSNNVIVKSDDGGDSWTYFNMTSVLPVGWKVVNLVVDPDDSQVIFAIGNEGFSNAAVVATFDGGATWENRTGNLPSGKPYNSLTISEQDVYIAGGQLFGGQIMGIYKTENYGQSWSNISGSFPNQVSNAILIDPDDTDKMYVATEGDGIYYTEDGGAVWNYNTIGAGDNGAARCLIFEPGNTDVIYAGFLSLAVCKSEDASQSWEFSNKGIATLQTDDVEVNPNDPLNILIGFEAENSGGCYLSDDGGETWQLVEGLPGTRFSQVTFGSDETMYAWSNGPSSVAQEGLYKSTDGGTTWVNTGPNIGSLFETEIFALVASETNPDLLFIGGNNLGVYGGESMIYRTTDGGDNWVNVYMGPVSDSFKYLFIDPNSDDQIIYTGYGNQTDHAGFMSSIDGGDNWSDLNSGIPSTNKWGGAIVCDPLNSDVLYGGVGGFGNLSGSIYKSIDGGGLWTQTSLNIGTYSKISDILISPVNSDVLYAATAQDGVYVSFDAGDNWEAANDGLPATNILGFSNSFLIDDAWYFCASTFSNSAFKTEVAEPGTTSIEPTSKETKHFIVFPNPSSGEISIKLPDDNLNIESLSIYNTQGRLLRYFDSKDFYNPVAKLSLGLSPNIYLCKIVSKGKVYTSKLVIVE
ncbi:MAG: T9SS type A sorting domain-containing protein, partial [Bacteroidales bacterium]|nr:T9SS type A sorting domain-containing protein [Bacteroidales bacterium]